MTGHDHITPDDGVREDQIGSELKRLGFVEITPDELLDKLAELFVAAFESADKYPLTSITTDEVERIVAQTEGVFLKRADELVEGDRALGEVNLLAASWNQQKFDDLIEHISQHPCTHVVVTRIDPVEDEPGVLGVLLRCGTVLHFKPETKLVIVTSVDPEPPAESDQDEINEMKGT